MWEEANLTDKWVMFSATDVSSVVIGIVIVGISFVAKAEVATPITFLFNDSSARVVFRMPFKCKGIRQLVCVL